MKLRLSSFASTKAGNTFPSADDLLSEMLFHNFQSVISVISQIAISLWKLRNAENHAEGINNVQVIVWKSICQVVNQMVKELSAGGIESVNIVYARVVQKMTSEVTVFSEEIVIKFLLRLPKSRSQRSGVRSTSFHS